MGFQKKVRKFGPAIANIYRCFFFQDKERAEKGEETFSSHLLTALEEECKCLFVSFFRFIVKKK